MSDGYFIVLFVTFISLFRRLFTVMLSKITVDAAQIHRLQLLIQPWQAVGNVTVAIHVFGQNDPPIIV